ncbi:LEAF RUST 10 DISEASE-RESISTANCEUS RECEPTOR-LIKE PROTEIN KINASE-like 1.2 isoform X3 [Medicago truncatula]|uniref:LEAF RUST 10 DISEASE-RESISTANCEUS RECEPTOR-LIKE PROTEIN KINASE-like 1.2 isoform X3 n=1 Tax=Medicago truncatula TaxID=3880 RepID=UPI000D2F2B17|nr:LEAF RUST 10 DISEASE-RESISTANCE LOCUS RECEPTOR-LIKE PROTEIN KINASE-like 1.2 isoform X3 [Medicago truncatula]
MFLSIPIQTLFSSFLFLNTFQNMKHQMRFLQVSFHNNKHQLNIITIILFLVTTVQSINPKFEACTPQTCGKGPSIKYPFWIPFQQDSFCGYPQFEITCMNNNPILKTSNYDLLVKNISYSNSSFIASNLDVYEENCPAPMYNYSLDQTPFTYSFENSNLSFFYNCTTEPIDYPTYEIECATNATHYSFAVFHKEALEHKNYSLNECQFMVNAPLVLNTNVNFTSLLKMNYIDVLKMGSVLNWTAPDCQHCEKSGGRCGFDNYKFICFCKDKSYQKVCGDDDPWNWKRKLGIGLASGVLGAALAVITGLYFYKRRKNASYAKSYVQSHSFSSDPSSRDIERGSQHFGGSQNFGVQAFTYSELQEATNNFDPSKELGEGGFGTVYFGKLHDGRSVAVKRLYENNYRRVEQFMNEVRILARLVHPNLVSLYGCTSRHSRELLLVYEYVSNGTVADHLHGKKAKHGKLSWHVRMNIAVETASALKYLHVSDIIHRDIKTNNILLDAHFRVKVADFGLSRLFPNDQTHVSTAPQGTPGYVDPEYHECYQLTDRSDVYSFGVVMIELISSLPAVDITRHRHEINLSNMAINRIQNRTLHEIVDPTLGFESDPKVKKMIHAMAELAFQCLQSSKDMRPSMDEVLETLKDIQSDGKHKSQPEVIDISKSADEAVLLNHDPPPLSPDSNILSNYTTPNASG